MSRLCSAFLMLAALLVAGGCEQSQLVTDQQLDALPPAASGPRVVAGGVRPVEPATQVAWRSESYEDWTLEETTVYALGNLGPAGVPLMMDALQNGTPHQQQQAATVLGRIGIDATEAAVPLANVVHSSGDEKLRKQAAWALSQIGPALWPQRPEPPPESYEQLLSQADTQDATDPTMPPVEPYVEPPAIDEYPLPMPYVEPAAPQSSADAERLAMQQRREKLEQERLLRRRQRAQQLQKEYEANLAEYARRLEIAQYVARTLAGVLQQAP